MKKFTLIFFLSMIVYALNAQDVIYTITGERNNKPLPVDSVLVENLTNSTKILFGNLPPLSDYNINLTEGAFWGATGIKNFMPTGNFLSKTTRREPSSWPAVKNNRSKPACRFLIRPDKKSIHAKT